MTDHEKTIRMALLEYAEYRGEHNTAEVITNALSALTALQEERERMRKDSRRLDAMIEHSWKVVHMPSHKDGPWHVWKPGDPNTARVHVATAETPREAIDAAIGEPAAQKFNQSEQWLREKAAAEDGCFVSVGGLVADLEPAADEEGGKPLTVQPSAGREEMPGLGPLPASDTDTGTADDQIDPAVVDVIRKRIDDSGLTPTEWARALDALTPEQIRAAQKLKAGERPESRPGLPDGEGLNGEGLTEKEATACECPTRKALLFVKAWFAKLENGLRDDDPLTAARRRIHAPLHAEINTGLLAPCPCEGMRRENARLQKYVNDLDGERTLVRLNKTEPLEAERDSLRAELAKAKEAAIAEYIDDNSITCDCCQHRMIDVTAKDGERQHCIAGDPEGEGSGCAWSFHGEVVPRLEAELAASQERERELREAAQAIACCGYSDIDPRMDYIEVHVDRSEWAELHAALATPEKAK